MTQPSKAGRTLVIVAAALLEMAGRAGAQVPPFTCPPVGLDTSCELLIVISPGGAVATLFDPAQPPFDGGDDSLVGVQNNSTQTITSLSLNPRRGKERS